MFVRYSHQFDRIRTPFGIQGVAIPPGTYNWKTAQFRFTPSPNRSLTGEVSLRRQSGFYGGNNIELTWSPLWKPSANLSLAPAYQFTRLTLPQGRFVSHLINSQVNYAFSNRWLTSATVQYGNLTRLVASNVRVNYIYRPGDDIFVIYNESRLLENGMTAGSSNRSLIVKMTRSVDF